MKEYCISGDATLVPNCENVQQKSVEEYFGKCKDVKYFEELPFFLKITETKPSTVTEVLLLQELMVRGFQPKQQ